MIKVGLTGNIGSGKSTVCKIFELLDVPVFYSDLEAKKLYKRDDVKLQLKHQFGDAVFKGSEVDFKKLASIIFSNQDSLGFVNNLIHPLVFEAYGRWLENHSDSNYTIHESAILFEHSLESRFDKTIVVYCPEEIRIQRVMKRDCVSPEDVKKRISNQLSDKLKNEKADFVVTNDGVNLVIPQIMKVNNLLTT